MKNDKGENLGELCRNMRIILDMAEFDFLGLKWYKVDNTNSGVR